MRSQEAAIIVDDEQVEDLTRSLTAAKQEKIPLGWR